MLVIPTKDYETIARLNKEVHDLHVRLYPDIFKAYSYDAMAAFFKDRVEKPEALFFVLMEQQEAVGYAWADIREYPESNFRNAYTSLYVHQLSIRKEAQGKGGGRLLMERIEQLARERNIPRIELDYWSDNERAKAFYKKNGYRTSREFVVKDL